jgi:hypothetical protein
MTEFIDRYVRKVAELVIVLRVVQPLCGTHPLKAELLKRIVQHCATLFYFDFIGRQMPQTVQCVDEFQLCWTLLYVKHFQRCI